MAHPEGIGIEGNSLPLQFFSFPSPLQKEFFLFLHRSLGKDEILERSTSQKPKIQERQPGKKEIRFLRLAGESIEG